MEVGVRFAGFGGQGLVMASIVLSRAAALYEQDKSATGSGEGGGASADSNAFPSEWGAERFSPHDLHAMQPGSQAQHSTKWSVQTQNYGAEARGGASRSEVKISDEPIMYPYIDKPDVLVIMSEPAFQKYGSDMKEGTILIIDPDTVLSRPPGKHYQIRATKAAEDIGKKFVANMIILGAVCELSSVVSKEALKIAVKDSVPKGTEALNLSALEKGFELGREAKQKS